ncbi:8-amino-7-oxononanoate synthase [Candidatus Halocynthiibacter alkanivorans]|uniref:8-amino-7-oxononanoate synthase n=1 Tax=Candidatus Halocynthiibacter alkanivorans TaxID=2267619 RepID=UPI000DF17C95|nr:8-amino-7-oxononanoate synthase [Candidatus Halocynthiibacter alkanivorans]
MSGFAAHNAALNALQARGRYRSLAPRAGLDFASNDYLGLAGSDLLRQAAHAALERGVAPGAGASRLLRGNDPEHEALELEAAAFFSTEKALFFGGGFVANTAIFASLPRHGDLVLHDALIHASAHDGMRLGRAEIAAFAHNDVTHAEKLVRDWRAQGGTGRIWLAFETVYSMDGDLAPVADLVALAQRHDAILVGDEAHATGVFGTHGRGLLHAYEDQADILTLHTCGKALGVSGALVCGAAPLIETLINRARGFIFATAPSPLNAALVRTALNTLQQAPSPSAALAQHLAHAAREAVETCGLPRPQSQIIPMIIGADKLTMAIATRLQQRGFDIRGIRPPTVPRKTARLRISITLNTSPEQVSQMFAALSEELENHQNG